MASFDGDAIFGLLELLKHDVGFNIDDGSPFILLK